MKKSLLSALLICTACFASAADFSKAMYDLNRGEFKEAIAELEPLVAEGYAPAQYQMATIHLNGWGTNKSAQKAFELFKAAADQNYPDAQFSLSTMYSEGKIAKKDLKMAFKLMQKAAEKNLASAQFNLGVMYAKGQGIRKDNLKAARWYQRAADQNYALAQYNLALMYYEGKGVEKSNYQSYIWNTVASYSGYQNAIKSRDMDERNLTVEQIKQGRAEAEKKYLKLVRKQEEKAKRDAERLNF